MESNCIFKYKIELVIIHKMQLQKNKQYMRTYNTNKSNKTKKGSF